MIATCRDVGGEEGWGPLRKELLELGITGGATHVDIEVLRLCWRSLSPLSAVPPDLACLCRDAVTLLERRLKHQKSGRQSWWRWRRSTMCK